MRGGARNLRARGAVTFAVASCVLGLASLGLASIAPAQRHTLGYAWDDPDWRFTRRERPVKVVLVAGSIGAYRDHPYGRLLHQWCANAEIRNISQVGAGASQLAARFREQVLERPAVPAGAEAWLLFAGGMNSVGTPHRTNNALRQLFQLAHGRGFGVVALSLTPWGSSDNPARNRGARGLHMRRSTLAVVDFVMGRSSPVEALGRYARARGRTTPDAPWRPDERAEVAVDLYDSPLRDRDAEPWPLDAIRTELERDPRWRRRVAELDDEARAARLESDARELAEAPRWFLRPAYRGFDDVHPNREGHRVIARAACPALPSSWGCRCPGAGE